MKTNDAALVGMIEPYDEEAGFSDDFKQYILQLPGTLTLSQLHRIVSGQLKEGLEYKDDSCRMLAAAIFAAAVHPRLLYVETGGHEPLWMTKLMALGFKVTRKIRD